MNTAIDAAKARKAMAAVLCSGRKKCVHCKLIRRLVNLSLRRVIDRGA